MSGPSMVLSASAQRQLPDDLRLALLAFLSSEPPPAATMTYDEFLAWADEDTLAEWVDGRVVPMSPASKRHQDVARFLANVLDAYASLHDIGTVIMAPFQMQLPTSGREPDVLFIANEHFDRLTPTRLTGAADLVVEVISTESRGRDRGDKFYEYQAAGVGEYWLIDPDMRRTEFYQLDEAGAYALIAPDAGGIYRSRVMHGLWIDVAWLWRDPPPPLNRVLLAIAGERYAEAMRADLEGRA
jgi:Uma2 family endonuclease